MGSPIFWTLLVIYTSGCRMQTVVYPARSILPFMRARRSSAMAAWSGLRTRTARRWSPPCTAPDGRFRTALVFLDNFYPQRVSHHYAEKPADDPHESCAFWVRAGLRCGLGRRKALPRWIGHGIQSGASYLVAPNASRVGSGARRFICPAKSICGQEQGKTCLILPSRPHKSAPEAITGPNTGCANRKGRPDGKGKV